MRKIETARRGSDQVLCPSAFADIWGKLPDSAKAALTGAQLAEVVRAMDRNYQAGEVHAQAEACSQGYVWDAKRKEMRDIVSGTNDRSGIV